MVTRRKQTVISTMQDSTPMSNSTTNTDICTKIADSRRGGSDDPRNPPVSAHGGGGVNDGRVLRVFGARADGGSRVDKHQIKVHSVHRISRAIFFYFFFFAS